MSGESQGSLERKIRLRGIKGKEYPETVFGYFYVTIICCREMSRIQLLFIAVGENISVLESFIVGSVENRSLNFTQKLSDFDKGVDFFWSISTLI